MTEIPDEIMKLAEKTLDLVLCNCSEADGDVRAASIKDIASALFDRDHRAAEIARKHANIDWKDGDGGQYGHGYENACGDVAIEILSYDEAQK